MLLLLSWRVALLLLDELFTLRFPAGDLHVCTSHIMDMF